MRFVISADGCENLVLRSQLPNNAIGYWIVQDGLKGWFGTPDVRESPVERKMSDGDLFPGRITQGARILTFECAACCESAIEAAHAVDNINGFVGKKLTIIGEDASGDRVVYGFLAEDPAPEYKSDAKTVVFTLIVKCPDPFKYSDWTTFTQSGGTITAINGGNAPSYPKIHVDKSGDSPITYMTLTHNGRQVTWTGSANSLDLDFADMVPSTGTVSMDNAFTIEPGKQTVTVSSNGLVTLYIRSAWR